MFIKSIIKFLYKFKYFRKIHHYTSTRIIFYFNYYKFNSIYQTIPRKGFSKRDISRSPILFENYGYDSHYIYHPAWAARKLFKLNPNSHTDISSSLNFVTIISAFIKTEYYEYNPPKIHLSGLINNFVDLTALPFDDNSIMSLSCMHVIEHIGLGRYGDKIDPEGDKKAINELIRVLAISGNLLFVVPIGIPKIVFNAHRVYSSTQIFSYFSELECIEYSLLLDDSRRGIINNPSIEIEKKQHYGCGMFHFRKRM